MHTESVLEYDVAVIGAGPVGLAVARLLALKEVSVALIDPYRLVRHHPRATHIDDETMRMLQTLGLAELEPGFLVFGGMDFVDADGRKFMQLDMPSRLSDQAWLSDYQTHQPDIESVLRGRLHDDDNVDLLLGWRVAELTQSQDHVDLDVAERTSGRTAKLRARYVVGGDGAGSFVRETLGVGMEDLQGTQRSLIIDIHPFHDTGELSANVGFYKCDEVNPITYLPIYPPLQRFECMLRDEDDAHDFESPAKVYELLSPWHAAGTYRIIRTDVYEWHAAVAEQWQVGRVFLAGDAAHLMPPMLGQGMCSGLRDAFNLAWKLALVVRGVSDAALLDTYGSERSPAVRPFVQESARQSNIIESFAQAENRPPEGPPITVERYRPPLGPGLTANPEGLVGQLTPQQVSEDGVKFDDVAGYNFVVMGARDVIDGVSDETRSAWRSLEVAVSADLGGAGAAWLDETGARAVIIRPDRYGYGAAASAAELDALTAQLLADVGADIVAQRVS